MKKNIPLIIIFLAYILLTFSCNNQESDELEKLKKEKQLQDSIVEMFQNFNTQTIKFESIDTILRLPNETEIVVFKNSFLNTDGTYYRGKVHLNFFFSENSGDHLFQQLSKEFIPDLVHLLGIMKFDIRDESGNVLKINLNNYTPLVRFHPKLKMLGRAYFYDSLNKKYSTPLVVYEKYKREVSNTSIHDYAISEDFIDFNDTNRINTGRHKHDGRPMTKNEVIGYELTLKQSGFYFISRKNEKENLQRTRIQITVNSKENLTYSKTRIFLYTEQLDYNYYLKAMYVNRNHYIIDSTDNFRELKLPLNNSYTIFAYHIEGDKCFYYTKKNLILKEMNYFNINLREVSLNKLVKEIKNL